MAKAATKEQNENTTGRKGLFIKKIKLDPKGTAIIDHESLDSLFMDAGTYTGTDQVTEEFKNIFQSATSIFCALIPGLKREEPSFRMNAINFDYDKVGFLEKASFSVVYTFNKQGNVLNLNTSLFPIYKETMSETTVAVSGKHEELLHEIIKKAKAYINGESRTKQGKLALVVDNAQGE